MLLENMFVGIAILTIIYLLLRYKRNCKIGNEIGFFLNPQLHLCVMSFFYLVVSSLILTVVEPKVFGVNVSNVDFYKTQVICFTSHLAILFFYVICNDKKIHLTCPVRVSKEYSIILSTYIAFFSLYLSFVLMFNASELISLRSNRGEAYNFYVEYVDKKYKIDFVLYFSSACFFAANLMGFSNKIRLFSLLPLLLLLFLDFTHGGRTISIKILLLFFLVYVLKYRKVNLALWFFLFLSLLLLGLLQRSTSTGGFNIIQLAIMLGEFVNTRLTVDYVYPYSGLGNISEQIMYSFSGLLPSLVRNNYIAYSSTFDLIVSVNDLEYGLASSIVSDSVYFYGDFYVLPLFIVSLTLSISYRFFLNEKPLSLLLLIVIIINIQSFFRSSFFDYFFVYFYTVLIYLFPVWGLFVKKRFVKVG